MKNALMMAGILMKRSKPLKTEIIREKPKSIITRNASPDISFDRSNDTYRGCEHGCVYCFTSMHSYTGCLRE